MLAENRRPRENFRNKPLMNSDKIVIKKIRAFGFHGVLPEERASGQPFLVSLEAELDLAPAGTTDDLAKTADYAKIAELTKKIVEQKPPFKLIEALAEKIAAEILRNFPQIKKITVEVHKPCAPIPAEFDDLYVAITRHR
ncbi:MAG: dihydroneopterin aldolase [Opitutae bacterium]|nr:dihydroneopterin aldolase [Opitutae bacterium]